MSITLIPSKDRNMYFGKRKLELGRIYEYAEELRKQEPTGRVHKIGGRRVFSIQCAAMEKYFCQKVS